MGLKRDEVLRQWLDKWYGYMVGVVSGYFFVDLSVIGEVAETIKRGGDVARLLKFFKGDILGGKALEAVQRFINMFSNEVFLSPLIRNDMIVLVVVELGESKCCVVGYGKEKWLCIFKTREREVKMIIANVLSLLGFTERVYELSGTRIFMDGLERWIKEKISNGEIEYAWVHNLFEVGGGLPKDLKLIIRAVENLFESPFFVSSLMIFLDQKSGRGVWCLRYHDKVSCIFSGLGGGAYSREISEAVAEVYDCYASGLTVPEAGGKMIPTEKELETVGKESVKSEVSGDVVEAKEEHKLQPEVLELKSALEEIRMRMTSLEGRVDAIESRIAPLLAIRMERDLTEGLDEKLRLIDEAIGRIRNFIEDFSEKLQELRRHKNDLLRSIEEITK